MKKYQGELEDGNDRAHLFKLIHNLTLLLFSCNSHEHGHGKQSTP